VNLTWSPEAEASLLAAIERRRQIAGDAAALRLAKRVADVSEQVERFPMLGRVVPEFAISQLRERIVVDYRFMYHVTADGIEIVAFVHGTSALDA
jgi:plasmid stabilization system protein ParE